tara:strand:- start:572 stop:691 length:120 start_codon:yes stop_codon:yes gene_type:complete
MSDEKKNTGKNKKHLIQKEDLLHGYQIQKLYNLKNEHEQ